MTETLRAALRALRTVTQGHAGPARQDGAGMRTSTPGAKRLGAHSGHGVRLSWEEPARFLCPPSAPDCSPQARKASSGPPLRSVPSAASHPPPRAAGPTGLTVHITVGAGC